MASHSEAAPAARRVPNRTTTAVMLRLQPADALRLRVRAGSPGST